MFSQSGNDYKYSLKKNHFSEYVNQSSYLSRISRIIFMEKKLSCGEISVFYTEFVNLSKFMPFLFQIYVEKKWQIWGLGQKCNKSDNTMARSVSARKWKMRSAQIWFDGVAPASTRLNGSQKKKKHQNWNWTPASNIWKMSEIEWHILARANLITTFSI